MFVHVFICIRWKPWWALNYNPVYLLIKLLCISRPYYSKTHKVGLSAPRYAQKSNKEILLDNSWFISRIITLENLFLFCSSSYVVQVWTFIKYQVDPNFGYWIYLKYFYDTLWSSIYGFHIIKHSPMTLIKNPFSC